MGDIEVQGWLVGYKCASDIHLSILINVVCLNVLEQRAIDDIISGDSSSSNVGEIYHMSELSARYSINEASQSG